PPPKLPPKSHTPTPQPKPTLSIALKLHPPPAPPTPPHPARKWPQKSNPSSWALPPYKKIFAASLTKSAAASPAPLPWSAPSNGQPPRFALLESRYTPKNIKSL